MDAAAAAWHSQIMLWHALSRRLPILALVYALALQGMVAGWGGAGHGIAGLHAAITGLEVLCRPSGGAGEAGEWPAPSAPVHDHDCAQGCLTAVGGGTLVAAAEPIIRKAPVVVALFHGAGDFPHLAIAAAAFAARAPPRLI